jgi:hypothetical protein
VAALGRTAFDAAFERGRLADEVPAAS